MWTNLSLFDRSRPGERRTTPPIPSSDQPAESVAPHDGRRTAQPEGVATRRSLASGMPARSGYGRERSGSVGGVGSTTYDMPRGNLTGDPYFTDGQRIVMWISGEPTAIDEIEVLDLSPFHTGVVGD